GDADRLRDMHFLGLELGRRDEGARRPVVAIAAATGARCAPAGTPCPWSATWRRLEGALLRRVIGPARGELLRLDRLLVARLGHTRSRRTGRSRLLVDRSLDRFLGRLGRLGLFGLLCRERLLRCRHHGADRRSLVFGGLATLGQIGGAPP